MSDTKEREQMNADKIRGEFEAWYATHAFDYAANPIGSRECGLQWKAWCASREQQAKELEAAQARVVELSEVLEASKLNDDSVYLWDVPLRKRVIKALASTDALRAADQQAQPFGYIGADAYTLISGGDKVSSTFSPLKICDDDVPLFTSPPAQPVRELSDAEIVAAVNSVASGFRNRPMEVGEVDDEIRQFVRAMIAASQKAE